jgi:hypothetical protein
MNSMCEPILIGYMPKHVVPRPDWLANPRVVDICSASTCTSSAPEGWIDHWLHNELWLFPNEDSARKVVPKDQAERYDLHAYRMFPVRFDEGKEEPFSILDMDVQPLASSYRRLGYDVVSRQMGNEFECSPLSCNSGAEQFEVNEHCLVDAPERAMELALEFSRGPWEPGPYYVVEVMG